MKLAISTAISLLLITSISAASSEIKKLKKDYTRPTEIPYLDDNKYSKEKEILGKHLFFDPRMSGSGMISCASCHNPSLGWSDGLGKAVGHQHKLLGRRTPTILNLAWTEKMMWDGRFSHLEGQALGPIGSADEMNMDMAVLASKIQAIPGYKKMFQAAFPNQPITNDLIAKAIAIFERGVISGNAPFDQWIKGDEKAISEDAKKGFALFNTKAKCASCHSGWRLTDDSFHDIGLKSDDIGRGKILRLPSQQNAFKTPGLRNIADRAPYMHDGSEQTLEQVIEFYNRGGDAKRGSLSSLIVPLNLDDTEKKQLLAFLNTLSSQDKLVSLPTLPK